MVDVILPVLDEEQALPGVLAGLPEGFHALVVDNGSTDASARVAAEAGATVIYESVRGFGAACWAGLLSADSDVVCFMDADGSCAGADLPSVVDPVLNSRLDLCLGSRRPTAGSWPVHARVANRLLARELGRRTGVRLTDIGPMRAARRTELLSLGMRDRAFGWPLEMVLRAAQARWRIGEVPVAYLPRAGGQSKVTGTVRGTMRTVRDMAAILG